MASEKPPENPTNAEDLDEAIAGTAELTDATAQFLTSTGEIVTGAVKVNGDVFEALNKARVVFSETVVPAAIDAFRQAAIDVWPGFSDMPYRSRAFTELSNYTLSITDLVFGDITETLREGNIAGESIPKLTERVMAVTDVEGSHARAIARTISIGSHNAGALEGAKQAQRLIGITYKKEWLSTPDSRTRVTHRAANKQSQFLYDFFSVGGTLLEYPGQPNGSPAEYVNCRCTMKFIEQ